MRLQMIFFYLDLFGWIFQSFLALVACADSDDIFYIIDEYFPHSRCCLCTMLFWQQLYLVDWHGADDNFDTNFRQQIGFGLDASVIS